MSINKSLKYSTNIRRNFLFQTIKESQKSVEQTCVIQCSELINVRNTMLGTNKCKVVFITL